MTKRDTSISLFNTLTKAKEDFIPLDANNVRMYVCGPTVYDYAHIGNARPVIVFDVLYRLLRHVYGVDHVTYVRNITDVDDKINARAAERGISIRELTEQTNDQFQQDIKALGCLEPNVQPRATETIPEMIAMIETLIKKKHAYAKDGHALFAVKSFKSGKDVEYGKLARRSLDDMLAGARVEIAPYKKDPMDFVLWKPSADNEPGWDSPWGRGRPGWHIECSAMAEKFLGETFDIHGGGIDLSFPHHENELAQSRCAHGTDKMAQIWMHNGFLQVEGKKMSKSLGNFITIDELLNTEKFGGKKWPGEVLRLAMLMTHYRQPIDFNRRRLQEAEKLYKRLENVAHTLRASGHVEASSVDSILANALSNDLDTYSAVMRLRKLSSSAMATGPALDMPSADDVAQARSVFLSSAEVLGFKFPDKTANLERSSTSADVQALIDARLEAFNVKDFAKADEIRNQLGEQGIQLKDSKDPETGARITTWEVKR